MDYIGPGGQLTATKPIPPPPGSVIRWLKCPKCGATGKDSRAGDAGFWGVICLCTLEGVKMGVTSTRRV